MRQRHTHDWTPLEAGTVNSSRAQDFGSKKTFSCVCVCVRERECVCVCVSVGVGFCGGGTLVQGDGGILKCKDLGDCHFQSGPQVRCLP